MNAWSCLEAVEDRFIPYRPEPDRAVVFVDLWDQRDFDEKVTPLIERHSLSIESQGVISSSLYGVTFVSAMHARTMSSAYTGPIAALS